MTPVVRKLFDSRAKSFFDTSLDSLGVLPSICDELEKYGLVCYFDQWFVDSSFPTYFTWKTIVYLKIRESEANAWDTFITGHSDLHIAQSCLALKTHHLASFGLFLNSSLTWSAVFILRLY